MARSGKQYTQDNKARRSIRTWEKGTQWKGISDKVDDDSAVPRHAVPMKRRTKDIQRSLPTDTASPLAVGRVLYGVGRTWMVLLDDVSAEVLDVYNSLPGAQVGLQPSSGMIVESTTARSVESNNDVATLLAVGDVVELQLLPVLAEGAMATGVIRSVRERTSKFARASAGVDGMEQVIAANADQVLIIMAAADPFYNKKLLDRMLISAVDGNVEVGICINKMDLMDRAFIEEDLAFYKEEFSARLFFISATHALTDKRSAKSLEEVKQFLRGKTTICTGPSGVGKSTLVNVLLGDHVQDTSMGSEKTFKGMHTTSFGRLFALPLVDDPETQESTWIVDTPGIREWGLWNVSRDELIFYFKEFEAFSSQCKFSMCSHRHEPDCAVKSAVEQDMVDVERYESYCALWDSLSE